MTQLTLNTQEHPQLAALLPELRLGTCIGVAGTVVDREKSGGSVNKQLATGAIEVIVSHTEIYGATKDLPFPIKDEIDASDLTRLKYRYLDLRRNPIARNIQLRSKVTHAIRDYMHNQEFLEIETPILMKSTPEGARDYLVPSREEPGHFYALPQSPQLYKQLLMIAGMDKYYQIARCFRDEDLRADRQPEFTQIDLEMSFVRDKDVHNVVEGMFVHIFREAMNIELTTPFPRMTYKEAMERFGEDKPDLRYGLELIDMTSVFAESGFGAFSGKCVKGIRVPNEAGRSKSWIKKLEKFIKQRGAGGLAWFKKLDSSWEASIKYFLGDGSAELEAIEQITEAQNNDLLFVVAHEKASSVN
ncbi:MAG TPA: aspartate--tRNA ligase, partial [Myxococcales bacterium]|nr:aspartate--tRNA ligase [Myxococcales bacterium]